MYTLNTMIVSVVVIPIFVIKRKVLTSVLFVFHSFLGGFSFGQTDPENCIDSLKDVISQTKSDKIRVEAHS